MNLYQGNFAAPCWFALLDVFSLPDCTSCSRKLDQSSASDSLLALPLSRNSVANDGVLGVR